jgi:hypothetical protein
LLKQQEIEALSRYNIKIDVGDKDIVAVITKEGVEYDISTDENIEPPFVGSARIFPFPLKDEDGVKLMKDLKTVINKTGGESIE